MDKTNNTQAVDVGALPEEPKRADYDADAVRFGACEHCAKRDNIRPVDGAMICGGCSEAAYLAEWVDYGQTLRKILEARAALSASTEAAAGEPIHQWRTHFGDEVWQDVPADQFEGIGLSFRRIVYAVPPSARTNRLTDEQRSAIKYARSVMGSVGWETQDSIHAKRVLDAIIAASEGK